MIVAYMGKGKGKTSACLGQVLRALGHDRRVAFVQFVKKEDIAGEQKILKNLLKDDFYVGGLGFFLRGSDRDANRMAALNSLKVTREKLELCDVVIADEILYALESQLLHIDEVHAFLTEIKSLDAHLIISGSSLPEELYPLVDTISNIQEIKHPWQSGIGAVRGIDF